MISKPNGGYGSTINAAIDAATGKYFKTLDGDDWYDTGNFVQFISDLKRIDADMVITPFTFVNEVTGEKEVVKSDKKFVGKLTTFETLPFELHPKIKMHSITYKTSLLKENHIRIGEHCFYTDIEYVIFPMVHVNSVYFLDYSIYQYRIGLEGQSVSWEGFKKHYKDHLKVIERILKFYNEKQKTALSKEKNVFIFTILQGLISTQYRIFLQMDNTVQTRQELVDFDKMIKNENHMLYKTSGGKQVTMLRKCNFKLLGAFHFYSKWKE